MADIDDDDRLVREATRHSRAIEDPKTRAALSKLRRRALRSFAIGALVLTAALVAASFSEDGQLPGPLDTLTVWSLVGGLVGVGFGIGGLVNARAAGERLRTFPWTSRTAKFRQVPFNNGAPAIVLADDGPNGEAYYLSGTRLRTRDWDEFDGVLLVAGDGRRRAAARTDREIVRVIYATRRQRLRNKTLEFINETPPRPGSKRWWQF